MHKRIFIVSLLILFTSIGYAQSDKIKSDNVNESDKRTQNFPREELKVTVIPEKKNVWVFLLAGQSNMAGRGLVEPQDTIPSKRILTINKNNELIYAKEPLHFYETTATGLDVGLSFGEELIKNIPDSISVLLLPTAVGGSSITQWLNDENFRNVQLFSNFKEKLELGKSYGAIKGIIWHQGESDANKEEIENYEKRLSQLISNFRKNSGNNELTVIIGELGSFSDNNEQWKEINEQIRAYATTDSLTKVVQTSDLKHKGDKVHFSSESIRILGKRYAKKYLD
ncbi:sialate O-acetylesterase [Salegentibacter sp. JZCK2]|uniref:sialate O-acetylesterase n=1 Tax=Salegentibacter tibetensis TaxID=2873600 RepID=UPI001CCC5046|nr:sialate O-acetylesterase [Salegentibacter tibetensis]MBZ9728737.1 sialate O-acetylesterase [Salegentibacter tibetensis]